MSASRHPLSSAPGQQEGDEGPASGSPPGGAASPGARASAPAGKAVAALRAGLIGLRTRLAALFEGPRYSDRHFWASLAGNSRNRESALLRQGLMEYRRGHLDRSAASVVGHFDRRGAPRFFVDARQVLSADPPADPRLHAWLHAAAEETREAVRSGLPVYGIRAASLRPGFPWQGRAGDATDDLLVAARPHRFAFAPRMALAVCSGATAPDDFRLLLEDWMRFAQTQPRLPFCSNLVVFQRLTAAAWACAFLQGARESAAVLATRFCLLKIINQDVRYLVPRLGDAFPNNHLLVDRFASWFIALTFPEFRRDRFDISRAEASWVDELFNQTYQDGGGFEHSVYYHGLTCEMAAAYLLLSAANGRPVAEEVRARIGSMLRLQAELCGPDGNAPDIGDASDDPIFPLDGGSGGHAAPMRELYRALFSGHWPPLRPDHAGAERAFWLLGGRLAPVTPTLEEATFREYPQSGLAVFLADAQSTRCTFRTGPSQDTRHMTGHMHSDLLSVTLVCGGVPFLIDPGTCTYRFGAKRGSDGPVNARQYFSGPRAHNGFVVGDRDPLGAMVADFRDRAAIPKVRHVARAAGRALAFLEADLTGPDGYPDVARGVIHLRTVGFLVYNLVKAPADPPGIAVAFQFAAGCTVLREGERHWRARSLGRELALVYSQGLGDARLAIGTENPAGGWASLRYGGLEAAPQLVLELAGPNRLTALGFFTGAEGRARAVECVQPSADARCFRIDCGEFCDYLLLNAGPVDTAITAWGVTFRGRAAWLRVAKRGETRLRWLDGMSCVAPDLGVNHECDRMEAELCL